MENCPVRKKLSAILFSDIQDYYTILQTDEASALDFLNQYHISLHAEVSKYQGEIVKNFGDSSLCLFSSVADAVLCARDLQLRLQQGPKVPLRIGLHVGDVSYEDNDVYGDAIDIASLIESLGVAGCVLLSKCAYEIIKNEAQLEMKSLGASEFESITESIEIFALVHDGLVVPKPSELKPENYPSQPSKNFLEPKSMLWPFFTIALLVINGIWF